MVKKLFDLKLPEEGLVLVAGLPGVGKTYVLIEMTEELNQKGIKSVLLYADGMASHDIVRYENGAVRTSPSRLSRIRKVYPDLSYLVEDGAIWYTPYGWEKFITDFIEHEHPQAVFIDSVCAPGEKASEELLQTLQRIAGEKHILIFAEINVSLSIISRKERHPKPKDVMCALRARKYVDRFIFVYRDICFSAEETEKDKSIEIYASNGGKTTLPFEPEKYSN